jgi:hypothetical protein
MRQLTRPQINVLRARAYAAGIDWDALSPLLRCDKIVQPKKGSGRPPGILPISQRTWLDWVARGWVDPPITFDNGVSAWTKTYIVTLALDGLPRAPGHGRKLVSRPPDRGKRRGAEQEPARLAAPPTHD